MHQSAKLTDQERTELLDWVSACQSSYHIDSTPGHRFGGLPSSLQENRAAVVDYVESILRERTAQALDPAIKTLNRLGYTWRGGELWAPPLGPIPERYAVQPETKNVLSYRLLIPGVDRIEAADEFLSDDAQTWAIDPNGVFIGMTYGGRVLRTARRAISTPGHGGA